MHAAVLQHVACTDALHLKFSVKPICKLGQNHKCGFAEDKSRYAVRAEFDVQ